MDGKKNIAIIGASGFLGSYLFAELSKTYKVIGTDFTHSHRNLVKLDIRKENDIKNFFASYDAEIVIICAGITRPDECEVNKKLAYDVNVNGIANICKYYNGKIIYFSTDYVFDGSKSDGYSEYDSPNPINYYGWTKLKAEQIVLNHCKNNVVIRVAGLYGYNSENNEFIRSLNKSSIYKAVDVFGSTLLLDDVAKNISLFFEESGIHHLSSGSSISRFEFAKMAVKNLEFPTKVILRKADEIYKYAKRPRYTPLLSVRHNLKVHKELEGLLYLKSLLNKQIGGDKHESV